MGAAWEEQSSGIPEWISTRGFLRYEYWPPKPCAQVRILARALPLDGRKLGLWLAHPGQEAVSHCARSRAPQCAVVRHQWTGGGPVVGAVQPVVVDDVKHSGRSGPLTEARLQPRWERGCPETVSYTHLRAHETDSYL